MGQGMSWREECGTGNDMERMAWNKECHVGEDSEHGMGQFEWECHGGRNVEQGITWREWCGTRNAM
jgi:hypothetical protein